MIFAQATRLPTILFVLFILMHATSTNAEPIIKTNTVYYEFKAKTRQEIWQQIMSNSPKGAVEVAGSHAVNVGLTEWKLGGVFQYRASLFKCRMATVIPELAITIHLPLWTNKWEADAKLADDWDRYVRMISQHEDIHVQYATKMVHEIYDEINKLGTFKRCEYLEAALTELKANVVGKYKAQNKWFDAKEFVYQKKLRWF